LKKGTPFAQVSATFSDAANALQGGVLGWRAASRLPQLFVDVLHNLQPGEAGPIVRSPNGFHILQLIDKRGQNVPMVVTQTHARHILVKVSELVSDADAQRRLIDLKERLDNGADFAALAKLHSEDGSAPRGGDLGYTYVHADPRQRDEAQLHARLRRLLRLQLRRGRDLTNRTGGNRQPDRRRDSLRHPGHHVQWLRVLRGNLDDRTLLLRVEHVGME
jgi:hypothetical protein